jgi:hypothetical protein
MVPMTDTILAVLMLAGFALSAGAIVIYRRGEQKRAFLMLVAALVMFANVAIWLAPLPAST